MCDVYYMCGPWLLVNLPSCSVIYLLCIWANIVFYLCMCLCSVMMKRELCVSVWLWQPTERGRSVSGQCGVHYASMFFECLFELLVPFPHCLSRVITSPTRVQLISLSITSQLIPHAHTHSTLTQLSIVIAPLTYINSLTHIHACMHTHYAFRHALALTNSLTHTHTHMHAHTLCI